MSENTTEHGGEQKEIPERVGQVVATVDGRASVEWSTAWTSTAAASVAAASAADQAVEPQLPPIDRRTRANQRHDPEVDERIEA